MWANLTICTLKNVKQICHLFVQPARPSGRRHPVSKFRICSVRRRPSRVPISIFHNSTARKSILELGLQQMRTCGTIKGTKKDRIVEGREFPSPLHLPAPPLSSSCLPRTESVPVNVHPDERPEIHLRQLATRSEAYATFAQRPRPAAAAADEENAIRDE